MTIQGAITDRVAQPTSAEVKAARLAAGLSQGEAAQLISAATSKPYRTWQGYEAREGQKDHRAIPLATWELFLLLTHQHPSLRLLT